MRRRSYWYGLAVIALIGPAACSGDDNDPIDPDPEHGAVRATVTGDGAALSGVSVRLFADGGVSATRTGTTAANGQVTFSELTPGAYDIDIVMPSGFELATGQTLRRDVTVAEDATAAVTFALQEIVVAPTTGQIRARVLDGTTAVEDVDVNLYAAGGAAVLATLSTGSDGRVTFPALEPAAYDVEVVLPAGFVMAGGDADRKEAAVVAGTTTDVEFSVDGPDVVIIQAEGATFTPAATTVAVGTTVRWQRVNNIHTVTPVGHSEWTEADLNASTPTFDHTFDQAGEYDYECVIHAGMTGTVTVE